MKPDWSYRIRAAIVIVIASISGFVALACCCGPPLLRVGLTNRGSTTEIVFGFVGGGLLGALVFYGLLRGLWPKR